MNRPVGLLILALAIATGCRPAPTPSNAMRYLALGDSYTIGESVSADDRWPVQLARTLRGQGIDVADPQIIAVTGWTTDELSAGIDRENPRGPFAMVTLLIGVNNQFRGRSLDEFRAQFRALLTRAVQFAGGDTKRVIVVSIPDWGVTPFAAGQNAARIGREIDAFNGVCNEEATRQGAAYVDVTGISPEAATDRSLVADDGLHPSGKMYARWVAQIAPIARAALARH